MTRRSIVLTACTSVALAGGANLRATQGLYSKVVASVPTCTGTDATWFDPATKLVFNSCSDGNITISRMDGPAALTVVETLPTSRGARTMTLDPVTHRIYTAAQKYGPPDPNAPPPAAGARGRGGPAIPDSFHVMVFEMKK